MALLGGEGERGESNKLQTNAVGSKSISNPYQIELVRKCLMLLKCFAKTASMERLSVNIFFCSANQFDVALLFRV